MNARRVLWITAIPPCFDAGGGGEIRQAHLLDALAGRFDVSLLSAAPVRDARIRARVSDVREVPSPPYEDPAQLTSRRLRDLHWALLKREPDEVARQALVRQALSRALATYAGVDIYCVEYIGLAGILPRRRSGLWALTLHNLTSGMARHSARLAPGRRQRLMLALEERNARRLEHWAVRSYDLVVNPSPEDAAMLPPGVAVVPNGVDTERFRPSPAPDDGGVVFTGALHTLPNRDGIRWFSEAVWPEILARRPGTRLDIVGSHPPPEVAELARLEGVEVHADVPDVLPYLARAGVAVVPLRIGTGSRLKALEAMAAARAVVGTRIGLGGLEGRAGQEYLVADDPGAFAAEVVRCLEDRDLRVRLGAAARGLVEGRYAWRAIGSSYADLLERRAAALDR